MHTRYSNAILSLVAGAAMTTACATADDTDVVISDSESSFNTDQDIGGTETTEGDSESDSGIGDDTSSEEGGDADADADGDGDTDGDVDADGDSDGDADGDTDTAVNNPQKLANHPLAGASCDFDDDCPAGMRCLQSAIHGISGYCAPPCVTDADCHGETIDEAIPQTVTDCGFLMALSADGCVAQVLKYHKYSCTFAPCSRHSYLIEIPTTCNRLGYMSFVTNQLFLFEPGELGESYNRRHADLIWRAPHCRDLVGDPGDEDFGELDGNSWCVFLCPENSGAVVEDGQYVSCACLPNFHDEDSNKGVQDCQWNSSVECSILQPKCTAENTEASDCSVGNFNCIVGESLEGFCFDMVTGDQIEDCVAQCDHDCDPSCIANCGATATCVDACCTSDNPVCD